MPDDSCMQASSKDISRAIAAIDGTHRSLLLFQGSANVQGLYDHLLAGVMEEAAASLDVPVLLAPVPFPGATLQQLPAQVRLCLHVSALGFWAEAEGGASLGKRLQGVVQEFFRLRASAFAEYCIKAAQQPEGACDAYR